MSSARTAHVVFGIEGVYDSRREWVERGFFDPAKAQALCDGLGRKQEERLRQHQALREHMRPFDATQPSAHEALRNPTARAQLDRFLKDRIARVAAWFEAQGIPDPDERREIEFPTEDRTYFITQIEIET